MGDKKYSKIESLIINECAYIFIPSENYPLKIDENVFFFCLLQKAIHK